MAPFPISLQLYTLRSETSRDMLETCRRVADIGYAWVELAGTGGIEPGKLRSQLAGFGLGISGAHVGEDAFDDVPRLVEESLELDHRHVILAGFAQRHRATPEAWLEAVRRLEAAAAELAQEGIVTSYHNHAVELEGDEPTLLSQLLDGAPTVRAQVDVFWAKRAGKEPAELIRSLGDRVPTTHLKDMGDDGKDIEIGRGVLDWTAILAACEDAGVQTGVVEMDDPKLPPFESVEKCLRNLEGFLR